MVTNIPIVQMMEVLRNTFGSRCTSKCETHSKRVLYGDWGLPAADISLSNLATGEGAVLDSIPVASLLLLLFAEEEGEEEEVEATVIFRTSCCLKEFFVWASRFQQKGSIDRFHGVFQPKHHEYRI